MHLLQRQDCQKVKTIVSISQGIVGIKLDNVYKIFSRVLGSLVLFNKCSYYND